MVNRFIRLIRPIPIISKTVCPTASRDYPQFLDDPPLTILFGTNLFQTLSEDHYNHSDYLNKTMMKKTGTVLCLWAMLAFIGPATTAANNDRYSLGGKDGEDENEQKTIDGPYRGRRLTQRPGPFGNVLDNSGVQTQGFIPEVRSTTRKPGEGETRRLKAGKKGKGSHIYEKPLTNYNYGKGKGGSQQEYYDYGKGKGKGGYVQEYYDYGKGKGKGGNKDSKKGSQGKLRPVVHPPVDPDVPDDDMVSNCDMVPDECKASFVGLDVLQNVNLQTVFVDNTDQNAEDLGTVYIFNDNLFNLTSDDDIQEIGDWFATGTCTRTQNLVTMGVGGGTCNFVYTLTDDDGNVATFTANGEVFDFDGGILSITGGARGFQGVVGQVQITPYVGMFNDEGELTGINEQFVGDFWGAETYLARVELELPPEEDCSCGCGCSS